MSHADPENRYRHRSKHILKDQYQLKYYSNLILSLLNLNMFCLYLLVLQCCSPSQSDSTVQHSFHITVCESEKLFRHTDEWWLTRLANCDEPWCHLSLENYSIQSIMCCSYSCTSIIMANVTGVCRLYIYRLNIYLYQCKMPVLFIWF